MALVDIAVASKRRRDLHASRQVTHPQVLLLIARTIHSMVDSLKHEQALHEKSHIVQG